MRRLTGMVIFTCVLFAAACSLAHLESAMGLRPVVQGRIVLRPEDGPEVVLAPESCLSGDRANFRGVDLPSPPYVLRVVADPLEGFGVAVIDSGGGRCPVFRAPSCAALLGEVHRSGWRVNDVWDVDGFIEADCQLASGERIEGKITFEHCH